MLLSLSPSDLAGIRIIYAIKSSNRQISTYAIFAHHRRIWQYMEVS